MDPSLSWISALIGVGTGAATAWLAYRVTGRSFKRGVYTPETAPLLLRQGKVSDWNAFRRLDPSWTPHLQGAMLDDLSLEEADFRQADLSGASLRRALLDGADFSKAVLVNADLSQASLVRVVFDGANLRGARFHGARLQEVSLVGADLQGTDLSSAQGQPIRHEEVTPSILKAASEDPSALGSLKPQEFERLVAETFERLGYRVTLSAEGHDGGVDLVAVQETPVGPVELLVQVKRASDPRRAVPLAAVRALYGVLQLRRGHMGVLVTNGDFTSDAREFALGTPSVRLIDGHTFSSLLRKAV